MRINHNISALNTYRQLSANNANGQKSLEKLSSGLRINRAGDDAAGLAISEKMRGQIRGLDQASRNAQDGISLIQTAEGALNETHSILQRMRELAVQSSSDTNINTDRIAIQTEINELATEVSRIATTTQFNNQNLLSGTFGTQLGVSGLKVGSAGVTAIDISGAKSGNTYTITTSGANKYTLTDTTGTTGTQNVTLNDNTAGVLNFDKFGIKITVNGTQTAAGIAATVAGGGAAGTVITSGVGLGGTFQIGANSGENVSLTIANMDAASLGVGALDVTSQATASAAISTIDGAITTVSTQRSSLGAMQNRLEHTINNLGTSSENLSAAESRVRDVDMAKEMMEYTKNNILSQAAQAMLAQANQAPQGVLQLLK
jgi:flagellin